MIVMRSISGDKLNPNIADFHRWRENMSNFARQYGINVIATRRSENLNTPSYSKDEHELIKQGKRLPIFGQLSTVSKPGKGSLDHLSFWQHNKLFLLCLMLDDFELKTLNMRDGVL